VDLLDPRARRQVMSQVRPEVLIHAAWVTDHGDYWSSHLNLDWVTASLDLARLFVRSGGRRFVGLGTCAERSSQKSLASDGGLAPSLYGAAKFSTATVLERFFDEVSVEFVWPRVFFTFGPGEDRRRFVPQLLEDLAAGRPTTVTRPNLVRDILPVQVLGKTLAQVSVSNITGAMDVGSGKGVSLGDVARILAELLAASDLLRLQPDPTSLAVAPLVADVAALRREFDSVPTADLREWLGRLVESWRPS